MSTIIQFAGQAACTATNSADSLVLGADIPADAVWAKFTPANGDVDVGQYSIVNGKLLYKGALIANATGAKIAILSDPALLAVEGNLFQLIPIVDDYDEAPALSQAGWAFAKQIFAAWLTPSIATIIEQHATDNGISLASQ